jgi:AraC-like DNA-binding protein
MRKLMTAFEQNLAAGELDWHRHNTGYAAIVLSGGYLERGDTGRWRLEPGDIVCHKAFEAHSDVIDRSGAQVLNVTLPINATLPSVFQVADTDEIIARVRSQPADLLHLLVPVKTKTPILADWPDLLAAELRRTPISLSTWSAKMRLAPATVSRGFAAAFGTTPAKYRASAQTHSALQLIAENDWSLSEIAHQCGFADQPHMSRSILRMTGLTPMAWRKVKMVQDSATKAT